MKTKTMGNDGRIKYSMLTSCCGKPIEWLRSERPEICPFCGDLYWNKPGLEYKLFHLQDEFVSDFEQTGSTRILGEKMFPVILEYAENLIKMLLKGKACLTPDNLYEKANDAATKLIEVILRSPDHRMRVSFGGYLQRLCKSVAYEDQFNDQIYSMQYMIGDDTEFGSTISRKEMYRNDDGDHIEETVTLNNRYDHRHDVGGDLSADLCNLIQKTESIIKENTRSESTAIMYLIGLFNKLAIRNDRVMNGFYEVAGNGVRDFVEKGELVLFQHLKQMAEVA